MSDRTDCFHPSPDITVIARISGARRAQRGSDTNVNEIHPYRIYNLAESATTLSSPSALSHESLCEPYWLLPIGDVEKAFRGTIKVAADHRVGAASTSKFLSVFVRS